MAAFKLAHTPSQHGPPKSLSEEAAQRGPPRPGPKRSELRPRSARVLASSTGSITLAGRRGRGDEGRNAGTSRFQQRPYSTRLSDKLSRQAWDIPESTGCTELEPFPQSGASR